MMSLEYTYMDSPVGQLMLVGEGEVLHYLSFPSGKMYFKPKPYWDYHAAALKHTRHQIDAYFAGQLKKFDVVLAPNTCI